MRAAGANVRARLVTERSANNYPALQVREGEEVFVWLSHFADERSRDEHVERSGLERDAAGVITFAAFVAAADRVADAVAPVRRGARGPGEPGGERQKPGGDGWLRRRCLWVRRCVR